jgi:hypothetical protein
MDYKLLDTFVQAGRDARRFLLIGTFLWSAILIGPSNFYYYALAAGLTLRGLFHLLSWYNQKTLIETQISVLETIHGERINKDDLGKFKIRFDTFLLDSFLQFVIIISIYPVGGITYYAEINNLETLETIFLIIYGFLFIAIMWIGSEDIEDFSPRW